MTERADEIVQFQGLPVFVSPVLPITPSPGTWARRFVRHGMADVLTWLGQDVGPKPDDETHALIVGQTIHASAAMVERLRTSPGPRSGGEGS